ncbi:MAG: YihY/virulence factor BrkB family protein [Lachnospiraceae bacterium]|nr:YihY/virulence factor BrkB family protein [Lachnospiraceae bacterium]
MIKRIRSFSKEVGNQNLNAFAASTAFFFILSLVPMLIMICTILPYTPLTEENLLYAINGIIPEKMVPLAEGVIRDVYEKSEGLLPIAVLLTLWSAGKGMLALTRGLNAVGDVKETRNYLVIRLGACFYTALMLVMVVLCLFVMVFGNRFVDMLLYKLPRLQPLVAMLMKLRFLAIWVLLTLLFAAIYSYVPNGTLKFRAQIPGAAFTAVGWSVFSWGFSLYVDWTDYSVYGSLALIILIMLWLYFCMYIILIGAYINRFFKNQETQGRDGKAPKMGKNAR